VQCCANDYLLCNSNLDQLIKKYIYLSVFFIFQFEYKIGGLKTDFLDYYVLYENFNRWDRTYFAIALICDQCL
jgi:hypothetical protein